ncbi:MAG: hypothetical protein JWQ72_1985, partial [Polaromonas sp.]|nr:hypothetical protein [Polaromonas sp.]
TIKAKPMSQQAASSNIPPASTPLSRALDQNESVKDTVEGSAAELAVINAVLKQELPHKVQLDEIAQALEKADDVESRIQDAASDLAQVNEVLEQEIGERARLERELKATKAALAEAKSRAGSN